MANTNNAAAIPISQSIVTPTHYNTKVNISNTTARRAATRYSITSSACASSVAGTSDADGAGGLEVDGYTWSARLHWKVGGLLALETRLT